MAITFILVVVILVMAVANSKSKRKKSNQKDSSSNNLKHTESKNDTIQYYLEKEGAVYQVKNNLNENIPEILEKGRNKHAGKKLKNLVDQYFIFLGEIYQYKKERKFKEMFRAGENSLELVESLIIETSTPLGKFDIGTIPAIQELLPLYGVQRQRDKIQKIGDLINYFNQLEPWKDDVEKALKFVDISEKVLAEIKNNPGIIQKEIKSVIHEDDGKIVANCIHYLEIMEMITNRVLKKAVRMILKTT